MPEDQSDFAKNHSAQSSVDTNSVERFLDSKIPIVTKTDLKGNIIYANPAFVQISGFSLDELLGKPHNVVRHSDMPCDAFKDLWETIRKDEPWNGFVKNRCKDGGYYWVDAYVTPLTEKGKKIGYMSVRSKPSDDKKREAETFYREVNLGRKTFPFTKTSKGRPFILDLCIAVFLPVLFSIFLLFQTPEFIAAGLFLSVISAILGLLWINNRVQATSGTILNVLAPLAEGNFRYSVPDSPIREFNRVFIAFKSMQVNLRAIVSDVLSNSNDVNQKSCELSELAESLMQRSQQQSDGIAGVAAALQELAVSVNEISEATIKSAGHARDAMHTVHQSTDGMLRSTQASMKVSSVVQEAKQSIEELNGAVFKISSVTHTITEIAERTNLLALNAAIEAARAGESGRGFAVVADEVRKLAEMTRQSTTEIAATVQEVQTGTSHGQETMGRAVEEVAIGASLIMEANTSLKTIEVANSGVTQSAQDISEMLNQQSQASQEVATSMERMSILTESNMTAIRALDLAAKNLASTSADLRALVKHFEASL